VGLIQDNVPWQAGAGHDPLGAIVTELKAQGRSFCIIDSADIKNGTINLAQFLLVVIASDQNQRFYNNLFPGGVVHKSLTAYVRNGGILSANLADHGWHRGQWFDWKFIGGLQHVLSFHNDNNIAPPGGHPIITDALPCPSGNCGQVVDQGRYQDLDGWRYSSHGYFINLPPFTKVILTQPDVTHDGKPEPVMVEYPCRFGRVIATLTTIEFQYSGIGVRPQNPKLLANDLAHQFQKATAITLASFSAEAGAEGVTLAWETGTEVDNAGFNLHRALTQDGPWTQINSALIPAQGDPVSGASYSFLDEPDYGTFYYHLEDVDLYGVSTLHGPVKATLARPLRRPLYRPTLPEF
jgi:hypothetical protein